MLLDSPPVILISGIPGAGKSTIARALAARSERGVHIEGDALQRMIVSGGEWPSAEITPEAARQMDLRLANACLLAQSFAKAAFTVVLDDVLIAFRLDDYRARLSSLELYFVLLLPDLDALRQRNAGRPDKDVFEAWKFLDAEVRHTTPAGLWLDTTALSEEETVHEIEQHLAEARL
ncbi:MAG TPA: AAA family ATPase [Dehalococcoidia bacterium]